MVVDLKATDDAVQAKGWVAPGLGVPGAPLGLLEATLNPLSGLAAAGLGWFMPLVSFLGDGLTQLQGGNSASVASGSQDFGAAGQDIGGVADAYRASANTQTSGWSGAAATEYRDAAAQHADGIAGLGQGSTTVASAIVGAGQVVAQAIAEVTELIAEAVAQIVPIMTQAIARAGETFGQSVVEAIPPCVGIAVEYALRIAAKLAALLASGENLMKLVQGGMAIVDLINQALSGISRQSVAAQASGEGGAGGGQGGADRMSGQEFADTMAAADPGSAAPSGSPTSSSSGGSASPGAMPGYRDPGSAAGSAGLPYPSTRSSGAVPSMPSIPSVHSGAPDSARLSGHGGGVPGGGFGGGGVQTGGVAPGLPSGAGVAGGRGGDTTRQTGRAQVVRGSGGGTPAAMPMGAMGAAHPAGDGDKEHHRKYEVVEDHEEDYVVPSEVVALRELGS
ncbi:hypothetical protein JCM33774_72860 [Actinophytocola sp. KF-1]